MLIGYRKLAPIIDPTALQAFAQKLNVAQVDDKFINKERKTIDTADIYAAWKAAGDTNRYMADLETFDIWVNVALAKFP